MTPFPLTASSLLARVRGKLHALLQGSAAGGRRERSIFAFFATSLLARGSGIACQLLQVPLALHYMGNEMFGLWITLSGISYMLSVADFGIGLGAQNRIAAAYAVDDHRTARRVYLTALGALTVVAAGLMLLVLPVCLLVNWPAALKLTEPAAIAQARGAAILTAMCCTAGITLSMGQRLAFAVHQSWLNNAQLTAINLLCVAGIYASCRLHLGLNAFILAVYVPSCVLNFLLNVGLYARLGWFRAVPAVEGQAAGSVWFDAAELRALLRTGSLFFVQQLCSLSLFTLPAVLISMIIGAAAVVPFNLAQRLFSLLLIIPNGFLPPLWPAYSEAKAKGDWPWIERTLKRSIRAVLLLTVGPMAVVSVFAHDLLRLWTHSGPGVVLPSATLVGLLFVWNALVVAQQPYGFMLAGLSEVRRVTVYAVGTAVTSVVLIFALGPRYGLPGIVVGLIAAICISLVGSAAESRRVLRRMNGRDDDGTAGIIPTVLPISES